MITHRRLRELAEQAIQELFDDMSVDPRVTIESLNELQGFIQNKTEALEESIKKARK